MKLKDKRFWDGKKRKYYPSSAMALKDAVKFTSLWTCMLLLLFIIMIFLTNDTLSGGIVFSVFLLLVCIFLLGVGMFLYENYCKQRRIINAVVSLLPQDCKITCIEYKEDSRQYRVLTTYNHKSFTVKVEYPDLWISEKDTCDVLGFLRMTSKKYEDNKKLIYKFMNQDDRYHCPVCGLPLNFAPWGEDGKSPTYEICPCCGVEWGNEDYTLDSLQAYRHKWLASGAEWCNSQKKPQDWSLELQLRNIKMHQ